MKCSKCNSENIVELKTLKIDDHNITFFACKDCCNVDLYCLDFKKKNELMEKTNKILEKIYLYRKNVTSKKLEALNLFLELLKEINNIELIDKVKKQINEINEYLNVEKLLLIKEENGYDDKGNIIKKTVYYIEDFPVNYNDCTNGHNGLFFYLSRNKYKELETVKHHKTDTTVLDILDEYYLKEAKSHPFMEINNSIKEDYFYKLLSLTQKNKINNIIELYNN